MTSALHTRQSKEYYRSGKIHRYLAADHERLDGLLDRAMSDPENIDAAAYAQFRSGLLKHIAHGGKGSSAGGAKGARRRPASDRVQTKARSRCIGGAARAVADCADCCGHSRDFEGP